MIKSDFSRMIYPKTIRISGRQFRFGVEALHDAAGKGLFCTEPVQQQERVCNQLQAIANDPKLARSFFKHPSVVYISEFLTAE
jgi:hypothetical protein